ncbi:MAG: GNAT family N-acetyltransferase [Lachnospiraceae bacterium]
MYRIAKQEDVEKLLAYFENDLKNCLYSYIDLKKFGIANPNLKVFLDEEEQIRCSALKYYEGLQLFDAYGRMDAEETAMLIRNLNSQIVSSTIEVIEKLYPYLKDSYEMEQGFVTEMKQLPQTELSGEVRPAQREDYEEIAKLICSDPGVGGHYEPEDLKEQLLTRLEEGFGRNYILKRDGEIIHHAATYAELENLAVISGVITRADWRGRGVGTLAVRKLCADLLREGKKPCLFYYTKQAEGFYKKIGFEDGTGWAKLVLRKEQSCTM